jgi:hypothetical protein
LPALEDGNAGRPRRSGPLEVRGDVPAAPRFAAAPRGAPAPRLALASPSRYGARRGVGRPAGAGRLPVDRPAGRGALPVARCAPGAGRRPFGLGRSSSFGSFRLDEAIRVILRARRSSSHWLARRDARCARRCPLASGKLDVPSAVTCRVGALPSRAATSGSTAPAASPG